MDSSTKNLGLLGATVSAMGVLGLVGWVPGLEILARFGADYIPMAPSTGIICLVLGANLAAESVAKGQTSATTLRLLGGLAALVGLILTVQVFWLPDFDIEGLFVSANGSFGNVMIGRMSPLTSINFLLSGTALCLLEGGNTKVRTRGGDVAGLCIVSALGISITVLLGYLYGTPLFYGSKTIPMALPTAIALTGISLGAAILNGPANLPLRPFHGQSMRVRLMRAFLPTTIAAVILAFSAYQLIVATDWILNQILFAAAAAVGSAALVGAGVMIVSRSIGNEIDAARAAQTKAETEMRQVEQKFLAFMENGPFTVFIKAADGTYQYVNPLFVSLYQKTVESLVGKTATAYVTNEQNQMIVDDDEEVLRTGRRKERQITITHEDGITRHWHVVRFPIVGKSSERLIGGIAVDMSEIVKAQEAEARAQRQLREVYKMAALGEMAGNIAHEVNNPLAVIDGRAMQLRLELAKEPINVAKTIDFADAITKMTRRLVKIVAGLQTLSRRSENDPLERIPVARIIDETMAVCAARLKLEIINVRIGPVPADLDLDCRPVEISHVLMNLVANACDAVREQKDRRLEITVVQDPNEQWIELSVSDNGPGIPPPIRAKIGSPLFTTKPFGSGTGLGLSISSALIVGHGGTLELANDTDQTRFVIRLPRRSVPLLLDREG